MSPRAALDPDRIVTAALAVLDAHGLEGLTVRRIADHLGVQNPALYWHVRNRQEIVDRLAERIVAGIAVTPAPPEAWRAWLTAVAHAARAAMLAHRDGARVLASADLSRSLMAGHVETALGLLAAAGFTAPDALAGVFATFDYTLGATLEEQVDPRRTAPAAAPLTPRLAAMLDAVERPFDPDATFRRGLDLLMDGLASRLRLAGPPP